MLGKLNLNEMLQSGSAYEFTYPGKVVPKARPRVTRRGTFYSPAYRDWKREALTHFDRKKADLEVPELSRIVAVFNFFGSARRNADPDNLKGSLMDALKQAEIIVDDSIKHLAHTSFNFFPKQKRQRDVWTQVYLFDLEKLGIPDGLPAAKFLAWANFEILQVI